MYDQRREALMIDRKPSMDQCELHLIALRDELVGRGVRCELDDRGLWPRLRIYCPAESATSEFDNNVVAAPISGRWYFCWPWAIPIGPVSRVAQAAGDIITDLGIGGDTEDGGVGQAVASLVVGRMLRQARLSISSPRAPGPASGGPCAACRPVSGGRGTPSGPRGGQGGW